jgi:hypothetical protein
MLDRSRTLTSPVAGRVQPHSPVREGWRMARDECRVTERGVAHLFAPLRIGGACACGRKVAVVQDESLTLEDVSSTALVTALETLQRRLQQAPGRG